MYERYHGESPLNSYFPGLIIAVQQGLIFRASAKPRRSLFSWENVAQLSVSRKPTLSKLNPIALEHLKQKPPTKSTQPTTKSLRSFDRLRISPFPP